MITIDEIKNELGFEAGDTSQDTFLTRTLEAGKVVVERIAGRKFFTTGVIEESFYSLPVVLRNTPVKELNLTKIDADGNNTILVEDTDFQNRKGIIHLERDILSGMNILSINYKIIENSFPELEAIVRNYVKRYYKKNKFIGEKVTNTGDGGTTSWENYITPEEISIIRSYYGGF